MRHVHQPLTRGGRNHTDTGIKFSSSENIAALSLGTNPPDLVQGRFLVNESHFGPVIGGFHPVLDQKHPERVHLAQQAAGKPSGIILTVMILVDQRAEPRIPRTPLAARRRGRGHMTEALEFRQRPRPTGGQVGDARSAKPRAVRMRWARHVWRCATQVW